VQAGVHPDLLVIRRDGQFIKVGDSEGERKSGDPPQIRQLIAAAQRRPYEGPVKALLVDEAHRMNASAANALLKTLEEPPADTVIVLTATMLGALPQTIVSRCRVVRFRALERSWLAEEIARVRNLPPKEAGLLAIFSEGRMDRALEIEPEVVAERRRKALELLDAGVGGRARGILASVGGVGRSRDEAEALLDVFLVLLRDLSISQRGVPAEYLINEDLAEDLGHRARQIPRRTLENLFERARKLRTDVRIRNANPQLGWEALLLSPHEAAVV
jgi:DNA polymerase-3 subunit delta'